MAYLVGTDEAGYGPNLGPLVVAASVWRVPDEALEEPELYGRLAEVVTAEGPAADCDEPVTRVWAADSKTVYSPARGLSALELGLWSLWSTSRPAPKSWAHAWQLLVPGARPADSIEPWYRDYDERWPVAAEAKEVRRLARHAKPKLAEAQVKLVALRCRVAWESEFDRRAADHGNKASLLSAMTLDLAAELVAELPRERVLVICDRHGGRHFYMPMLQTRFSEWLVEVCAEGPSLSSYRCGPPSLRTEFRFAVGAERHLPCAVASMAAKYLRELAMRAFNRFWCQKVDGLRPTAGYPGDSRRFLKDIAERQRELAIPDHALWRKR